MASMMLRTSAPISGMRLSSRSTTARRSLSLRVRAEEKAVEPTPSAPAAELPPAVEATPMPPKATTITIGEAMAFSGPAPEQINGRLSMLGFVAALFAELASGETVAQQFGEATVPIILAVVAFSAASLIPILKGAKAEAFGPLTPAAEMLNGRAAMIGLAALIGIEAVKGTALF